MRQRKYELLQAAAVIYASGEYGAQTSVNKAELILGMIERREHETNFGKTQDPQGQTEIIPF